MFFMVWFFKLIMKGARMSAIPRLSSCITRAEEISKINYDNNNIRIISKLINYDIQKMQDNCNEDFKPYYEYFITDDLKEIHSGFGELSEMCYLYKINIFTFLRYEIGFYQAIKEAFTSLIKKEGQTEIKEVFITDEELYELVISNLTLYIESDNTQIDLFLETSDYFKKVLFETTLKVASDEIQEQKIKVINYNYYDVRDDLSQHINEIQSKFKNKRTMAKFKTSYLSKFALDEIAISEKYNMPYLKNYKDGLAIGYSQRAFLMGVDKQKAIRELETKIKILEDYDSVESKILIQRTKELLTLTKQKKHKDKMPFKTIGKKLNMTTGEARNLLKSIISTKINDKSFNNFYTT